MKNKVSNQMAENSGDSKSGGKKPGQSSQKSKSRKPVTIDLDPDEVKEVVSDTGNGSSGDVKETAKTPDGSKETLDEKEGKAPAAQSPTDESPADEAQKDGSSDTDSGPDTPSTAQGSAQESQADQPENSEEKVREQPASPPRSGAGLISIGVAACLGGIVALAGTQIARNYGWISDNTTLQLAAFSDQIEAVNTALREQQAESQADDLDAVLASLRTELDQSEALVDLETRISALEPAVSQVGALSDQLAALQQSGATSSVLGSDDERVLALQVLTGELNEKVSAISADMKSISDQASELATSQEALSASLQDLGSNVTSQGETAQQLQEAILQTRSNVTQLGNEITSRDDQTQAVADTIQSISEALETVSNRTSLLTSQVPLDIGAVRETINEAQTSLSQQLEGVSNEVGSVSTRVAALEQTPPEARILAAARVAAVGALSRAVASESPYETELSIATELGISERLGELSPFAATGLPSLASLQAAYKNDIQGKIAAALPAAGTVNRLFSNAMSLVQRDGVALSGEDSDILLALNQAVARGNIDDSLAHFSQLPQAAREAGATWEHQLKIYKLAWELIPELSRQTLTGLSKTNG